jgi:aminoglycoside phosphotransferase (APT) family kinase protein
VRVVDDSKLIDDAEAVIANYGAQLISESDRVLLHADVGFHNLVVDPSSHTVRGIFDYDGAAWADRHHDFRYLMFDEDRFDLLEATLSVYEAAVGRKISRERLVLYNAACAISFLACRAAARPDDRPCGRTLAEDLRWTAYAISRVGPWTPAR